jgi:hypothetical protein
METVSEPIKTRREIINARQIGLVVALGGIGFAWVALGFLIPLYPPMIIDLREPTCVLAAMIGGPYVGLIVGIIHGLGTGSIIDIPYYPILGFVVGASSRLIWRLGSYWKRIVGVAAITIVCEYFLNGIWAIYATQLAFGIPFWTFAIPWWTIIAPVYVAEEAVLYAIALKLAPDFVRPRWTWRGGEIVEIKRRTPPSSPSPTPT